MTRKKSNQTKNASSATDSVTKELEQQTDAAVRSEQQKEDSAPTAKDTGKDTALDDTKQKTDSTGGKDTAPDAAGTKTQDAAKTADDTEKTAASEVTSDDAASDKAKDQAETTPASDSQDNSELKSADKPDSDQKQKQKSAETAAPDNAKEKVMTDQKEQEKTAASSTEAKAQDNKNEAAASSSAKVTSLAPTRADDVPYQGEFSAHIIVVTSGKGGVGKTTSAAALSTGLALKGHKTAVIDFDVGLRNLDLVMGVERRVVYDFINVIHGDARLNQALIQDRHTENLFILPASQTKDKESLTYEGVGRVLKELSDSGFEYIICDSPAGIEQGALIALYYADEAIVTTNPEVSSVRDSDRIIGILNAKSRRAVLNQDPVEPRLLLTRYVPRRVAANEMLSINDVQSLLTIPLLGVIPESPDVLKASNEGVTIILNQKSEAGLAYQDAVERLLGTNVPMRFTEEKKGLFNRIFGK